MGFWHKRCRRSVACKHRRVAVGSYIGDAGSASSVGNSSRDAYSAFTITSCILAKSSGIGGTGSWHQPCSGQCHVNMPFSPGSALRPRLGFPPVFWQSTQARPRHPHPPVGRGPRTAVRRRTVGGYDMYGGNEGYGGYDMCGGGGHLPWHRQNGSSAGCRRTNTMYGGTVLQTSSAGS